jgi:hypothetical protein
MNKRTIFIGLVLLMLFGPVGSSHATLVFSEDFNSATGVLPIYTGEPYSEKWSSTNYYVGGLAALTGWTFSPQAYLAENGINTADKAILLNEAPHGSMSTTIGAVAGGSYLLTFDHWGDNRPGTPGYQFTVSINGTPVSTISRIYNVSGPGVTESILFTAQASSIVLSFLDNSPGQASPIIDNIKVSSVPIPGALWLFAPALAGLVAFRRRLKK